MKLKLENGVTIRPVTGCFVVVFFCGMLTIFSSVMLGAGTLLFTGVSGASDLTEEVHKIVEEDPYLADTFGSPVKIGFFGSSFSATYSENVTNATYNAPISGPIQSGELVAKIKKLGDETRVTSLVVYTDSGRAITVVSE